MAFDGSDLAAIAAYMKIVEQQHDSIGRAVHAHDEDWLVIHQIGIQQPDGSCLALAVRPNELMPQAVHLIKCPPRFPTAPIEQPVEEKKT